VFFSGEFDKVVINPAGKSDLLDVQEAHAGHTKPLELPSKGVSELDRLSHIVHSIENDCQVVPRSSFKMTPIKEVRRNDAFKGLSSQTAFQIESYQHFRKVVNRDKREQIDRDEGIYNHDFLDEIQTDYPKGAWNILRDTTQEVALIRSKLWPGYYGYHRVRTSIFGGVYIGNGIKNLDLPFML
jgi:radial spoke head protein 9